MDVWALGVLIFFLGSKQHPFSGDSNDLKFKNIVKRLNIDSDHYFMKNFPNFYSDSLKDFIKDLLIFDPK